MKIKQISIILCSLLAMSIVAAGQGKKLWSEWDKSEVDKILNDSPWGRTQTETDTRQMVFNSGINSTPVPQGPSAAMSVNYRVRFFSAKPIREALSRIVLLSNPNIKPGQLQNFINGDYSEIIVVAVTFDGADRRYTGPVEQAFNGATTGTLKNTTYLERNDGTKVYLEKYTTPSTDGTGAKFVFPRNVGGKPYVAGPDEVVRFVSDFRNGIKISWKFKLSDMMYEGKLEF